MNKKYLLACGDSFTEGHVQGKKASWATYVGPLVASRGGMSNGGFVAYLLVEKQRKSQRMCSYDYRSDFYRTLYVQPVIEGGS